MRENKGIATAQNIGIAKAREIGAEFVIFFDQDSQCEPSLIDTLQLEFITMRNSGMKIGAIGPMMLDKQSGKLYDENHHTEENPLPVTTIISSGTFTSLDVLDEVGEMSDTLFIDYVDHEWCWRAQNHGYRIFESPNAILSHQVGDRIIKFCGHAFLLSAPLRYYYQYRNALWLTKFDYVPISWKRKTIRLQLAQLIFIPWYTSSPLVCLLSMLKGIVVGLRWRLCR